MARDNRTGRAYDCNSQDGRKEFSPVHLTTFKNRDYHAAVAVSFAFCEAADLVNCARSIFRARLSLDMTAPMGMPSVSLISL
jgi:hypothetical protein